VLTSDVRAADVYKDLERMSFLSNLDPDDLLSLAQNVQHATFTTGEYLCRMGDRGECMYILKSGSADVLIPLSNATASTEDDNDKHLDEDIEPEEAAIVEAGMASSLRKRVLVVEPGMPVGEKAILMESDVRSADVVATCDVSCYVVYRKHLSEALRTIFKQRLQSEVLAALENVELFSSFTKEDLQMVASKMQEMTYQKGDFLVEEGEDADYFYIIKQGYVDAYITSDIKGTQKHVGRLEAGEYFGEQALISHKPRAASIRASSPAVTCWRIHRVDFGPLRPLLEQSNKKYNDHANLSGLSQEHVSDLKLLFVEKLQSSSCKLMHKAPHISEMLERLCLQTIFNFLEGDLFISLKRFLGAAKGSFGLATCSTIDPEKICIASRNQAMYMSFNPRLGAVLWGSEAAAQSVQLAPLKPDRRSKRWWEFWREQDTVASHRVARMEDGEAGSRVSIGADASLQSIFRHDLDETGGEVVEIAVFPKLADLHASSTAASVTGVDEHGHEAGMARFTPFADAPEIALRVFNFATSKFMSKEKFLHPRSLIDMQSNPFMSEAPPPPRPDIVRDDIEDIPRILDMIHRDWKKPESLNRRSARELYKMLAASLSERRIEGRMAIDVLVIGMEASLWIAEHFASDLQNLFPNLRVVPVSANKIVGVLSNNRGKNAMAGFSFCSVTSSLERTIVISISHSGQTFPTLHATHALRNLCGNRVFVVTGSIDSKLAGAVGQRVYSTASWRGRVIHTYAGWRSSESLTLSTAACHHTLSELLIYLGTKATINKGFMLSSACPFVKQDIDDMERLSSATVYGASQSIVGVDANGERIYSRLHKNITMQGYRWGLHILESPISWLLSAAYIAVTVNQGWGPLFVWLHDRLWRSSSNETSFRIALALDSVFYMFLPLFFSLFQRILTGRQLMARLGKRTIVIGDVPYVHQMLESYVSKMFAMSYSIASVDVHGANAVDHLVHRFTHRVARGVLLAMGRPDGRLVSQTKSESWVLMACMQAKAIVNLGAGPEIWTVGHNPYFKSSVVDAHSCLETHRPKFMCEALIGVESNEPMRRLAAVKASTSVVANSVVDVLFEEEALSMRPIGMHLLPKDDTRENGVCDSSFSNVNENEGSLRGGSAAAAMNGGSKGESPSPARPQNKRKSRAPGAFSFAGADARMKDSELKQLKQKLESASSESAKPSEDAMQASAAKMEQALMSMSDSMANIITGSSHMESFCEARFASFERYMAFLVAFHSMASTVAGFWPLNFDISRSQSQLRIATTAAPISAAEIEREWADHSHSGRERSQNNDGDPQGAIGNIADCVVAPESFGSSSFSQSATGSITSIDNAVDVPETGIKSLFDSSDMIQAGPLDPSPNEVLAPIDYLDDGGKPRLPALELAHITQCSPPIMTASAISMRESNAPLAEREQEQEREQGQEQEQERAQEEQEQEQEQERAQEEQEHTLENDHVPHSGRAQAEGELYIDDLPSNIASER